MNVGGLRLKRVDEQFQRDCVFEARERYQRAVERVGEVRQELRIAGTRIRLRFAGEAMVATVLPALAHHAETATDSSGEQGPIADICIWDTHSTGVDMAPPPCDSRYFTNRGTIYGFASERYRIAFHYSDFSFNAIDVQSGSAVHWVRDARAVPPWGRSSPLRSILHWWFEQFGCRLVHAAAIGTMAGAVLIPGKGGAGKSTTALSCLRAGMRYLGDDYVLVQLDPEPRVFNLYATAKLEPAQLERLPEFADCGEIERDETLEKAVLFLHPNHAASIEGSLPLRAVLLPLISGRPATGLARADVLATENAARFTTFSHLPHSGERAVRFMTRLASELPRATIELGTRLEEIPAAVAECAEHGPAFTSVMQRGQDQGSAAGADLPLVSVIVPVRNGERFVREAADSIMSQGYPRLELIFIDDGSTDATAAAIRSLPYDVCRFDFATSVGPAEARNRGVREAAGEIIAFLDVDDLWPAGRLERGVRVLMDNPELGFVQGRAEVWALDRQSGSFVDAGVPRAEVFPHSIATAIYRAWVFHEVGPYDRSMLFGEDSDWFHRAEEDGIPCRKLDDVWLLVRRHDANMTLGKTQTELNRVRVLKGILDRKRARGEL